MRVYFARQYLRHGTATVTYAPTIRASLPVLCLALLAGCREAADEELVIISPHSPEIRAEFSRGFEEWSRRQTGRAVGVRWLDVGGTGESIEYIRSRNAENREGGGVDVFFGGGNFPFVLLKKQDLLARHAVPDSILASIPRRLHGMDVYQDDSLWYGAALSGFGILCNKEIARRNDLPLPGTWADLASRECVGWVSSADPRYSGSMHAMYEILLQAYGWERGWDIITRMGGNIQSFTKGASNAAKEVSTGQAAFGLAIDFYAFIEIQRYGGDRLSFVLPQGESVINADGIAVLRNAPSPALAASFVNYVLSEGQKLWILRPGVSGGPTRYALCRFPVDSTLYDLPAADLTVTENPYASAPSLEYDGRLAGGRWSILGDLIAAFVITPHQELRRCWAEAVRRGLTPAQYRRYLAMELSEQEVSALADKWNSREFAHERIRLMNQWTGWAERRYRGIFRK